MATRNIYVRVGVSIANLKKPIRKALPIILGAYRQYGEEFILITSTNESSAHREDSFHYQDLAIDTALPQKRLAIYLIVAKLKEMLGRDYDIILHADSHIHIEYDPK
jgi:hypothetical protein